MNAYPHVDMEAHYNSDGELIVEPGSDTQWFSPQLIVNADDRWLRVEDGNVVITAKNGRFVYRIDGVEDLLGDGSIYAIRARRVHSARDQAPESHA